MKGIELGGEKKALNTAVLRLKSMYQNTQIDITAFSDTRKFS